MFRSLPEKFRPKVTAIEESKDLDVMIVEDLVGSLQTYELSLPQSKKKNLALRSSRKNVVESFNEDYSNFEEVAMLAKKLRKFFEFRKGTSKNLSLDLSKGDSQGSHPRKEREAQ
jgi:predicted SPOUT superfamily RNA methylase MTH1